MRRRLIQLLIWLIIGATAAAGASHDGVTDVHLRIAFTGRPARPTLPVSVLWLVPVQPTPASPFVSAQHYSLVQKNREFKPHLLVVPVGSVVDFPNKDPFFHNVFSLFDGRRFDLGLYEAGSTKSVTFSREGVSYIFCNIHPEMSAVILTLSTSLYSAMDSSGTFHVAHVPDGEYEMHIWIEGIAQPVLDRMSRRVHVTADSDDLGVIEAPAVLLKTAPHANMYGKPYDRDVKPTY
jgi:plastocyanin